MREVLWSFAVLILICPTALAQPSGPEGANDFGSTKRSSTSLKGRVERVYSSERPSVNGQSDTLFAIELALGPTNGSADRQVVFVKTWQAAKRTDGTAGPVGQMLVPSRGDIVECDVTGGPTSFEAITPHGIRIAVPGACKSQSIGLEMTLIDVGEFQMGSPGSEENRRPDEMRHRVKLSQRFYLGIYEVTQAEYKSVMQARPSAFAVNGVGKDKVYKLITDRFPVESVTWYDAVEFCNRLSVRDGLKPYYLLQDTKTEVESIIDAAVTIAGGTGYRLPTEAEWEYACRAGTMTPFQYGAASQHLTANVKMLPASDDGTSNSPRFKELGRTAKVGSYPPNPWGLFDMHGNVAEWCQDWYDKDYYDSSPVDDPKGPNRGTLKVLRGGSWTANDITCRSAARSSQLPAERKFYGGIRVARNP